MKGTIKQSGSSKLLRKNRRVTTEANEKLTKIGVNCVKVQLKVNETKKIVIDVPKGTSNKVLKNELDKMYKHSISKQDACISY